MKALVVFLLMTSTTRADVVSVPLFALSSRAVAVEAEHPLATRLSLGVAAGVRDPSSGDFGGYAFAVGPVLRGWLRPTQRGVHAVVRVETNVVRLRRVGMQLGTAVGLDPAIGIGYRFVIRDRVAITPDAGLGGDIDFGHRGIPTQRRWTSFVGLSVGARW